MVPTPKFTETEELKVTATPEMSKTVSVPAKVKRWFFPNTYRCKLSLVGIEKMFLWNGN